MSNPTYGVGSITAHVEEAVDRFRLVTLGADGVKHATAGDVVYGAVTEPGAPGDGLPPRLVSVHRYGAVPVEVDGDVADYPSGTVVSASADGKVTVGDAAPVGIVIGAKGGSANAVVVDLRLSLSAAGGDAGDGDGA